MRIDLKELKDNIYDTIKVECLKSSTPVMSDIDSFAKIIAKRS